MNKYQKALEIMCNGCEEARACSCDGYNFMCHSYAPLKELVEKAAPKKVIITKEYFPNKRYREVRCPHCNSQLFGGYDEKENKLKDIYGMNFCFNCGQALDWGGK